MKKSVLFFSVVVCLIFISGTTFAGDSYLGKSKGQVVYLPATYCDFSYWKDGVFINQYSTTRIIIRNTAFEKPITVTSVKFYNPDGGLVKEYLDSPEIVGPLASISFGANFTTLGVWPPYNYLGGRPCFIVKWKSNKRVNTPIISHIGAVVRIDGDFVEFLSLSSGRGTVMSKNW